MNWLSFKEYNISSFFIGGMSPEGEGYALEDERPELADLQRIPRGMAELSRDGLGLLGRPENELLASLVGDDTAPGLSAAAPAVAVDALFDVYPNIAEPAPWWRLGNLKRDGVDAILHALWHQTTPGMTALCTLPLCELARRYGDPSSTRLYDRDNLISRFMHQWGEDWLRATSGNA